MRQDSFKVLETSPIKSEEMKAEEKREDKEDIKEEQVPKEV